ncbi:MAG: CoB--CoM heterodisulfide reductase iron-sulfur subunit A family protein [Methanosarcinaceae archaeon]|nr:CoB--CoM heterodisulfide reductase iron-sulfur subunit A family protein [Methanosarcinaceae archaeon]
MSKTVGAVAVIGGGIAGVQSALDLANSGYKVYLIETKPSIGGVMAQLDKTFPTMDCSACILSPKLVEAGRHPNVELMTYSDVCGISGKAGNFTLTINKKTRYVDVDKCVGCGDCIAKCPKKVDDEFEEGLVKRKAIYFQFTQAIPKVVTIDAENCLKIQKDRCGNCAKACKPGAIDYTMKDEKVDINVGAVIVATGFKTFDPTILESYHFENPDVITALQYERYTNASGPFDGNIQTSKGEMPKKIAFIQCIGSRNSQIKKDYCSSVCCTYAVKQARLTKDHHPEIDIAIFNIDLRTFGKGFEEFATRTRDEDNVRFINSRPSGVDVLEDGQLQLKYEGTNGELLQENFDLVVLSVGLETTKSTDELTKILNVETDEFGFIKTEEGSPTQTSVPGIFTAGVVQGPKDIPDTVAQASSAAAQAGSLLSGSRKTLETIIEKTPESPSDGEPRVGVIICRCGTNIANVVDVPSVVDYARTLPNVIIANEEMYSCADDTQERIKDMIREHKLNRFVVAACTPRTHEPLFQQTCEEAGMNPWLFEFANIREHCSWVHPDKKEEATVKAQDLVRQAVAKVIHYKPLYSRELPLHHNAVVLGGGLAGLYAAYEIAENGYNVDLIEKTGELGGTAKGLKSTEKTLNDIVNLVNSSDKIKIHFNSEMKDVSGSVGNFKGNIETNGKVVDTIDFGVIVIATGANELKPENLYGFGENFKETEVITLTDMKHKIDKEDFSSNDVVFIQCVGSRNEERPYCSRLCCTSAIQNAVKYKKGNPDANVYVLYRDIRTYGKYEADYKEAREIGIHFMQFDEKEPPEVSDGFVNINDKTVHMPFNIKADCVVLSAATIPNEDNKSIAPMMKVPLNPTGFFMEVHPKLRPLDFGTDGVFVCGMAQSPQLIPETISQAQGAASRACTILSKDFLLSPAEISSVDQDLCVGCGACENVCPYNAITLETTLVTKEGLSYKALRSYINPAACKGCGCCAMACPTGAIDQGHFENNELLSQIKSVFSYQEGVN